MSKYNINYNSHTKVCQWGGRILKYIVKQNDETEELIQKVLKHLVDINDYIRIDSLAQQFYLSRSSMERVIKKVKKLAKEYDLEIFSRPKYGICIKGTEINKRTCSAHLNITLKGHEEDALEIQEILYRVLKLYDYTISDVSFHNLVHHIYILLGRIRNGNVILEEIEFKNDYTMQIQIAEELIRQLNDNFGITIPPQEKQYLVLHLLGKQIIKESREIEQAVFELVDEILERIYKDYQYDLRDDFELRISLCLHLQPLIYRLKYHFNQKNPLLDQIKRELGVGYEMALITKKVIYEKYALELDDDEAGFLAMHFSLSLSREKSETSKKLKVIVICSTGQGTAKLLVYKLIRQYKMAKEDILITSMMQLQDMNLSEFDCVISTIAMPFEIPIPVIHISPFLDDRSFMSIDKFIMESKNQSEFRKILCEELFFKNMVMHSKEDVLTFIVGKCAEYFPTEKITYEELINRENLSSTEVGNFCCLPHPASYFSNQPVMIVILLDKTICWENQKVKYIFFVVLPKDYSYRDYILEKLTQLICSQEKLYKLEKEATYQYLLEALEQ